ncbi:Dimethyl sulfoxide/trimethylamine N-oxide reductase precursor [Serratia plymuthica]|uniref:Dimethyl sulfoxide/trimethylamine N-oxide reductase n=1 Tax=Serratia plymuthica TaxID=82996 RepID=A0A2X4V148_SERPL|nr:Dimethyl sulfoxide/trimethylamine N-oxide reductase precursor [Serratia plymuthica]
MMPVGTNPCGLAIPVARICDMLLQPGEPYSFRGETLHYPDIHLVHWPAATHSITINS